MRDVRPGVSRPLNMRLQQLLCRLNGHKLKPDVDYTAPGEIRCLRCGKLFCTIPADEPTPDPPLYDKSYWNGCHGKTRFASREQAEARMARMKSRPDTLHPYPCQHCKGWHLGNYKRRDKRR